MAGCHLRLRLLDVTAEFLSATPPVSPSLVENRHISRWGPSSLPICPTIGEHRWQENKDAGQGLTEEVLIEWFLGTGGRVSCWFWDDGNQSVGIT